LPQARRGASSPHSSPQALPWQIPALA